MRRRRAVRIEPILREGVAVEKDAARLHYVVPVALHVQQRVHAVLQARVRRAQAALFDHLRARVASRHVSVRIRRFDSFHSQSLALVQ